MTGLSPLAAAEEAKRRRDIGGEIGALIAGEEELARQPWAPLRPGDVVLCYLPGASAYGQTFVAVDDETDVDGHAMMREVSRTDEYADPNLAGFYELWFEAGPRRLTVIRAGAVVFGSPARAVDSGVQVEQERPDFALVDEQGRCGCCQGVGDHPCGHECGSCDGSGRNPDSPICTLPHGGDCSCTAAIRG